VPLITALTAIYTAKSHIHGIRARKEFLVMAKFQIPKKEFEQYPPGLSEGIIYEIEDIGIHPTPFGDRHKIIMKIESLRHTIRQGDQAGDPMTIWTRYNLSGHKNSQLRPHREAILGRPLTEEEAHNFDSDELVGVRVFYVVIHQQGNDGKMYARIDSIGRLDDQTKGTMMDRSAPPQDTSQQSPGEPSPTTQRVPAGQGPNDPDALPF